MKKHKKENYLEKIPEHKEGFLWTNDEKGIVTISVEKRGFFNRLAQKLLKKPPVAYVHLDENGSFVWCLLDGKKNIIEIGEAVREKLGDASEPLYPRLARFFQMLESYGFVGFK